MQEYLQRPRDVLEVEHVLHDVRLPPSAPAPLPALFEKRREVDPDGAVRLALVLPGEGDAVVQPGQEDAVAVGHAGGQHRVEHGPPPPAAVSEAAARRRRSGV